MGRQKVHEPVRLLPGLGQYLPLVFQGDHLQPVLIEIAVREGGNLRMHPSLPDQLIHQRRLFPIPFQEPFEERQATILQPHLLQQRFLYSRFYLGLLHHGRQLLVITNQDKFPDGDLFLTTGRQEADNVRLQNLGGLINDGEGEALHR